MPTKNPRTEPHGELPSSSFKYNPLQQVRVLYTSFVQGLFAAAPRGDYHWEPDDQATEIYISAESPIKIETLNMRPGITFTRAPVGFHHLGFDDLDQYDFQTGRKIKSVLIPGTMVINCCSKSDLESEHIAWVVAEHLWMLRDLLMQHGFYDIGRNIQVGSPSAPGAIVEGDSADEWFCTSVTSPYQFYRTSARTPLATGIIQSVQLALSVRRPCPIRPGMTFDVGAGGNPPVLVESRQPGPFAPGAPDPNALPVAPHPLNPAQIVTVRRAKTSPYGLRPPGIGNKTLQLQGAVLPISGTDVKECDSTPVVTTTVKV